VVKGGYRSRFTENKAALSQFTKNTTLAFHAPRKIKENILENHGSRRLWKPRFTRKKLAISHFTGKKKGRSRVTKIPFTTFLIGPHAPLKVETSTQLVTRNSGNNRCNELPQNNPMCVLNHPYSKGNILCFFFVLM